MTVNSYNMPIWLEEFKPKTREERSKMVSNLIRTFPYREHMPDCLRKAKETQRLHRRDWTSLAKDIYERIDYTLVDKYQQPFYDPDGSDHAAEE